MPFLYLTTKGWKSGRPHEIEIWYVSSGPSYYIVSEMREKSHWVQNIRREPHVSFKVGSSSIEGRARVLDAKADAELVKKARELMIAEYGWGEGTVVEILAGEAGP